MRHGLRQGCIGYLERHGAALCVAESDDLATPDVVTAGFTCYRRRKTEYSDAELAAIAGQLRERAAAGEVFAYFKHEEEPTGALWAAKVLALVAAGGPRDGADRSRGSHRKAGVVDGVCAAAMAAQRARADAGGELSAAAADAA